VSAILVNASSESPDTPVIEISSPVQNNIYVNSDDVWLNFTVIRPDSWSTPWDNSQILCTNLGKLTYLNYFLDDIKSENISINDGQEVWTVIMGVAKNFSFSFKLSELSFGQHSLRISAYGVVYVSGGTSKNSSGPFSPVVTSPVVVISEVIAFTVAPNSSPPVPESSWLVIVPLLVSALFVAVIIGRRKVSKQRSKVSES
jgi:hypothetical protein